MNYYAKVSKYDLDRSNVNMAQARREKQRRRELNARAKREMINGEVRKERFVACVEKINRIKEVSAVRKEQIEGRR